MSTKFPHILLADAAQSWDYTNPQGGGKRARIPSRNREEHSSRLIQQFRYAWQEAEEEQQVAHEVTRKGIYLEFRGEPGFDFATGKLENRQGHDWVRLLNVRTEERVQIDSETGNEEKLKTKVATVFVPKSRQDFFLDRLEQYATKTDEQSGKPRNAALVNSISEIRKALAIDSFWQDSENLVPVADPEWCEVWLNSDEDDVIRRFEELLMGQNIESKLGVVKFPERAVKVVNVTRDQLAELTRLSDDVAEFRRAKETASFWVTQDNKEQTEWVKNLLSRLEMDPKTDVAVCLFDTGTNSGHPLLNPLLQDADCQSVNPDWGWHDHNKHGTLMAGVAAYGDLSKVLASSAMIHQGHLLESVKILPPDSPTEPDLWAYITSQGVSLAEIQSPSRKRIHCMAVTSEDNLDNGRPSSWSAELDQICSGAHDDVSRLFLVSAGNCPNTQSDYPEVQCESSVQDPAQSWNALTVGAYTELDQIQDPELKGYEPVAPKGGLSPFSTTSVGWDKSWPIKPEIVMEGGNLAKYVDNFCSNCDDLSIISTSLDPSRNQFSSFAMTSASTARAAWFAAQIQAKYPEYWPETIRALMVHSAEWTETMEKQFHIDMEKKGSVERLLRTCGYGVPDLGKALYCASDSLTLISQSSLQPFTKKERGGLKMNEMHLYELPWPAQVLENLHDVEVRMRVTLSYFVEPGPGEIGWKDRYRYPSHNLKFHLKSPGETREEFVLRINQAARDEENGHPGTKSPSDHWVIGAQARDKGSIHSDIWVGSAAELASSNVIAISPHIGWWRGREYLGRWDRRARYALVVSISTPEQDVDIYTPVATQIGVPVQISVN